MLEENKCGCDEQINVNNMEECNCCNKNDMMNKIQALDFAVEELVLYLDTHPEDQKALCLHREYSKQMKKLKDIYQRTCGPLTIDYPCNKWRWIEEPWPWERGNN